MGGATEGTGARRVVVKVGSTSLVEGTGLSRSKLAKVVGDVASAWAEGRDCILVSSGAIASGLGPLGLSQRPRRLPALQAAAAVGQGRLMAEYQHLFERHGILAAQVLLTEDDFVRRRQFVNAHRTIDHLLRARVVPVVNENDTVATAEITFGDNDRLAALVAIMVKADLLVLLSDVDGIYGGGDGPATLLEEVLEPPSLGALTRRSALGSGGMASKVEAASLAASAGVPTVVANAAGEGVLARILAGERVGTRFPARGTRRQARKAWMAFVSAPQGRILVDGGAREALRNAGRSLLAAGVVGVEGAFAAGDPVEVVGPDGRAFARGIASLSAGQIVELAGRPRDRAGRRHEHAPEVIHRDHLVLTEGSA